MVTNTEKIRFLETCFGDVHQFHDGINVAVKCPKCGEPESPKKKLGIRIDNWNVHCWVCGIKGKNIYYVLKKHVSIDLAKQYLNKFDIVKKEEDDSSEEEIAIKLPDNFLMLATNLKSKDPDVRDCLGYLRKRGVTEDQLWYHKIGTCVNGFGTRRVFFPSFDNQYKLNYYVSRAIDESTKPKYLNAKVHKKTAIIFDEMRIEWDKELTIVEGVFDMLKSNQNSVPLLGSSLHPGYALFDKIVHNRTPVLLALDEDVKFKTYKIAKNLSEFGVPVRILNTAGYEDVGAMNNQEFLKRAQKANNYSQEERLFYLIDQIQSGSLF